MAALLHLEGVSSGYGRTAVLHEISLEVAAGEIVALIGANGAGKSTLLNTVTGLIPTRGGSTLFDAAPIDGLDTERIVRLGVTQVPERRQLFGTMTVEENLLMGAYARADRPGKARLAADLEEQYEQFPRLKERRRQLAQSMSGGEQQMAAIARALMSRPRLLLLDEPSLGLAPLIVRQIMEQIVTLRRRGCTILLVEQNARVALEIADRGYVLETGRITLAGPASDLLDDPAVQDAYLGGQGAGSRAMEERIRARAETYRASGGAGTAGD
ncbi:MAG TPA: ABC transporter ATP-binding protein [Alphaproteobacteria bacterium]|jgi:branched-chain amino acid transport system ATP-binding protein|nr:ABC transporter ATP-binding protein [Alphaproteobacteria bacterium]